MPHRPALAESAARTGAAPCEPATLARDLAALAALPLDGLRVQFRNRTGRIAPARISRPLLLRVLAYRLQAERFGDLPPDTCRLLDRLAAGKAETRAGEAATLAVAEAHRRPRIGTVLVREWQGRSERVSVADAGFGWNGTHYPSLSAVATAITGTKWNGRRFFGLDRDEQSRSPAGRSRPAPSPERSPASGARP